MNDKRPWTEKMMMAALIIGVAGAAARSATTKVESEKTPEAKKTAKKISFKGVTDRRLALLMFEFERSIKAELAAKKTAKQSESGPALPPPKEEAPTPTVPAG